MFYFLMLEFISELLRTGIVVFLDSENCLAEFAFVAVESVSANVRLHDACRDCKMNHKCINAQKDPSKTFSVLLFTGGIKQVCFDVSLWDWSVGVWPNLFFSYHCFVQNNSTLGSAVFSVGADQPWVNMLFQ